MSLNSQLESLLFIANKPLSTKELSEQLEKATKEIELALDALLEKYEADKGGLRLIKSGNKYQLVSAPENSKLIQNFLSAEVSGELTRPSLEALTVIAYRGPISKIDLDRIRGVNCALIIRNLLLRGLVEEKFDKSKNQVYYNVTLDFIRFLGINRVEELPDFERLATDDTLDKVIAEAQSIEKI